MSRIFSDADVGRKNIGFGIALFLILGVVVGIPLTFDFLGGSLLSSNQYQTWKVVHGYGVFLAFINYFFGLCIDRLDLARRQKEISSWSFLLAGLIGGLVRMALVLLSVLSEFGVYASLGETAFFILGMLFFVRARRRSGKINCWNGPPVRAIHMPNDSILVRSARKLFRRASR